MKYDYPKVLPKPFPTINQCLYCKNENTIKNIKNSNSYYRCRDCKKEWLIDSHGIVWELSNFIIKKG